MGPTNVALVNLFRADQHLREAIARLDAAERNVRIQERRVADLSEKSKLAQTTLREQQSRSGQLELDLRSREAHIEKLRIQQQTAKNNKEYQAFLVEINTAKVDRAKVEDETLKVMEAVEKGKTETAALQAHLADEQAKLATMKAQIGDTVAALRAEVDSLRPARDAAAAAVPPRALQIFERLADHHEGEAMAALAKPDRRREEYLCTACNMELVRDVYNKLRVRDEVITCPSCQRILFIPEGLSPEEALGTGKPAVKRVKAAASGRATRSKSTAGAAPPSTEGDDAGASDATRSDVVIEPRAKGRLGEALAKAQGETVRSANAAGQNPIECEVFINGDLAGIYKGQSAERLERAIKYYMAETGLSGKIEVRPVQQEVDAESEAPTTPAADSAAAATSAPEEAPHAPTEPTPQPDSTAADSMAEATSSGAGAGQSSEH